MRERQLKGGENMKNKLKIGFAVAVLSVSVIGFVANKAMNAAADAKEPQFKVATIGRGG